MRPHGSSLALLSLLAACAGAGQAGAAQGTGAAARRAKCRADAACPESALGVYGRCVSIKPFLVECTGLRLAFAPGAPSGAPRGGRRTSAWHAACKRASPVPGAMVPLRPRPPSRSRPSAAGVAGLALLWGLLTGPARAQGPQAVLSGVVREAGLRTPVGLARVEARGLAADLPGASAVTDDEGRFSLTLLPGTYQVRITGHHHRPRTVTERIAAPGRQAAYYIERQRYSPFSATVRAGGGPAQVSQTTLSGEELTQMPGTGGDAPRAVETLPGVGRPPLGLGFFIVRGGRPTDSRVFLHGLEVPQLYHFGGLRAVVPGDLIARIDFLPGSFDARYGRATTGVIDLTVRPGRRDGIHGAVEISLLDAGARVEAPVGRGSLLLAARRSYIDAILRAALPRSPRFAFLTAPAYYDYQARLDYPVGGGQLRLFAYGSDDRLGFAVRDPLGDVELRGRFDSTVWFHRLEASYTRPLGPLTLSLQQATGVQHQGAELGQVLDLEVTTLLSHLRLEGRYRIPGADGEDRLRVALGLDLLLAYSWLDVRGPPPPTLGDFNIRPSTESKLEQRDQADTSAYGAYLSVEWRPVPMLVLLPGVRVDLYRQLTRPGVDPRLGLRLRPHPLTTFKAAAGLYSQPPQPYEIDPTFGNPRLPLERALQLTVGAEQALPLGAAVEVTGFLRLMDQLTVRSTAALQGPGGAVAERYHGTGAGRAYGLEVLLRQRLPGRLFGWLSYTLQRSERSAGPGEPLLRFDFDQTHVLNVALHVELPWRLALGGRFRYLTGLPYTPQQPLAFDADADVYRCTEGPLGANSARLPPYHQFDLRVDKRFVLRRFMLVLSLDVQNVYSRLNPEQVRTSYECRDVTFLTGLFTLPILTLRAEF